MGSGALAFDVLGSVLSSSPSPDDEVCDGFHYLVINFSPMLFHVAAIFPLIL